MDLKLMKHGTGSQVSIVLMDCVGEYGLNFTAEQLGPGIDIRDSYVQFANQEAIEFACKELGHENLGQKITEKYFDHTLKEFEEAKVEVLPWFSGENYADLFRVTFWGDSNEEIMQRVIHFEKLLGNECLRAVEGDAHGDDSFFDYVPSYVDMYRQFCTYFGAYEEYSIFVASIKATDPDFFEEALYCNEIKPI